MPIDVHAHYVPQRIIATLEERAQDFGLSLLKTPPQCAIHFDYGLKVRPFFQKLIEPVGARLDGEVGAPRVNAGRKHESAEAAQKRANTRSALPALPTPNRTIVPQPRHR